MEIAPAAIRRAVGAAWEEQKNYHRDIRREGQAALEWMNEHHAKGIVLAGRPYHVDKEVNHGIPELINGMGLAVLSEDSIAMNQQDVSEELRVLDQWVYHSRLYRAAEFVTKHPDLELIQLNSFGCGLDAVTSDQVQEILESKGKLYTLLKIDEVSNLGAVKIRIRSLLQALSDKQGEEKRALTAPKRKDSYAPVKAPFTKRMKKEGYTILVPNMAPNHFAILEQALAGEGYHFDFLTRVDPSVIDAGLKYVNNDSCYPSITVIGQMLEALESGKYDPDRTALLMTQTGGACRASNYVGYIRKGLADMGYPQVPVIALSVQGIEVSEGFSLRPSLINKAGYALVAGDLVMRCANATRPYEKNAGQSDRLKDRWIARFAEFVVRPHRSLFKQLCADCVHEFDTVPRVDRTCPKAGIVGEILVKYLPEANNHLQQLLEAEGAEVIVPDLMDFMVYCFRNAKHKSELLGKSKLLGFISSGLGVSAIEYYRKPARKALRASKYFQEPPVAKQIERYAQEVVSLGHQYGEGWLLAGEMVELIEQGAPNIVCIQPFGCLPNHITGKGVMKAVREKHPEANIIAIDYDPGASEVNQVNRVKLMMSSAWDVLGGRGDRNAAKKTAVSHTTDAVGVDPPVILRRKEQNGEENYAQRTQR